MGAFSIWHWIIVLIVVLILFGGKGKLSGIMGDFGKGLRNFKDQMKSKQEEDRIIANEVASLKKKMSETNMGAKKQREFLLRMLLRRFFNLLILIG